MGSTNCKQAWARSLAVATAATLMPAASLAVVSEDQVLCYVNRPCIETITTDTRSIQVSWRGKEYFDFYNVRWSRQGMEEVGTQKMIGSGNRGSIALTKILPNTQYVIKVQGCNTQLLGGPSCTEWEMQEIVTPDFVVQEPTPASPQTSEPAAPMSKPATEAAPTATPASSEPSAQPANNAPSVVVPTEEAPAPGTPAPQPK